ncbi:MAG: hypothetical protein J6P89_06730 [Oscillospiraceae bacterium]|nr:hypothetical protein [Oscillospiraceae bacterium]
MDEKFVRFLEGEFISTKINADENSALAGFLKYVDKNYDSFKNMYGTMGSSSGGSGGSSGSGSSCSSCGCGGGGTFTGLRSGPLVDFTDNMAFKSL